MSQAAVVRKAPPDQGPRSASGCLPRGHRLREFVVESVLGEGGFGVVYSAIDLRLERRVAIKEYMPTSLATRDLDLSVQMRSSAPLRDAFAAGLRSFINEAKLLARFEHPALIKVHQFWQEKGTAYMVMPYFPEPTLRVWVRSQRTLPDETWVRNFLLAAMDAIETLHNGQCLHRDIAPDNILVLNGNAPLLLDFGAARRVIGDLTQALTVVLKPGYAPIEQYADTASMKQGPWTNVYGLCAVAYFMVTGHTPAPAVSRMLTDDLIPASRAAAGRYSPALLDAIDAGLAVRPYNRPQSMAELRTRLCASDNEFADTVLIVRSLPDTGAAAPATSDASPAASALSSAAPAVAAPSVNASATAPTTIAPTTTPASTMLWGTVSPNASLFKTARRTTRDVSRPAALPSVPPDTEATRPAGPAQRANSLGSSTPAAAQAEAAASVPHPAPRARVAGDVGRTAFSGRRIPVVGIAGAIAAVIGITAGALWWTLSLEESTEAPAIVDVAVMPVPQQIARFAASEIAASEIAAPETAAANAALPPVAVEREATVAPASPAKTAKRSKSEPAPAPRAKQPPSTRPTVVASAAANKPASATTSASGASKTPSSSVSAAGAASSKASSIKTGSSSTGSSSTGSSNTASSNTASNNTGSNNTGSSNDPSSGAIANTSAARNATAPNTTAANGTANAAAANATGANGASSVPASEAALEVTSIATASGQARLTVQVLDRPQTPVSAETAAFVAAARAEPPPAPLAPLRAVAQPRPAYPTAAARAGVSEGRVVARLQINADGSVADVQIIEASPLRVFDREVLKTLAQWRYEAPGERRQTGVELLFRLDK